MSGPDYDMLLQILLDRVTLVPFDDFEQEYPHALRCMEHVDEDDTPFLAVGFALDLDGIWTEDRHFLRQDFLKVYSTNELVSCIEKS
jgi:predicted nucleic acid-binding protein